VGYANILYIIIFVPYNLFKLFLVHKISAYKYIYDNGKRKKKKDSKLTRPEGFWPGRARARGVAANWAQMAHKER
jgi:hypothetical protein